MPPNFPIKRFAGSDRKVDAAEFGDSCGRSIPCGFPCCSHKIRDMFCKRCIASARDPVQNGCMISHRVFLFPAVALIALASLSWSSAEDQAGESASESKGFRFLGGDPQDGRRAFTTLNCIACHSVKGVDLKEPSGERLTDLVLARETRFVKRYEDIILAITNPRHVITEQYRKILTDAELQGGIDPLMPDLTKDMSAEQLIDLTAFLHSVYAEELPAYGKEEGE